MSNYGKACLHCTKTKVRCSYTNESGPCDRCIRLRKQCQPATRTRITKSRLNQSKQNTLETKFDFLIDLLKKNQTIPEGALEDDQFASGHSNCATTVLSSLLTPQSLQTSDEISQSSDATSPESQITMINPSPLQAASCLLVKNPCIDPDTLPPETEDDLQNVLNAYRDKMYQFFPVVYLGPEVTVELMAKERPFVWLMIRVICTKMLARQFVLAEQVRRRIANALIVEAERNFDILCALVLYTNWGQFFCLKANLSPSVQLAMGLVGDLGLNKPVPQTSPAVMMNWTSRGCPKPPQALSMKPRTMEERRIVLGLFLISSVYANFFQRVDPMRWTPYLEESLILLAETKEHPGDELLAILIRMQLIFNGVQVEGWNESYPLAHHEQSQPRESTIGLHKMQLDEVKRSIPSHLLKNQTLQFALLSLEFTIYEQYLLVPANTSNFQQAQCIEGLWTCFKAVKGYVDTMFDENEFARHNFLHISMAIYTQLGHCLVTLFRLSTFESANIPWDRQRIVMELDLGNLVRKWIEVYDTARQTIGLDLTGTEDYDSQWEHGKKMLFTTILKWWESKVRPSIMVPVEQMPEPNNKPQSSTTEGFDATLPGAEMSMMDFGFDSDMWMKDIFNSGLDFSQF